MWTCVALEGMQGVACVHCSASCVVSWMSCNHVCSSARGVSSRHLPLFSWPCSSQTPALPCHPLPTSPHPPTPPFSSLPQVPELEGDFSCKSPNFTPLLEKVTRAQALLGKSRAIPMLIGPVTFVLLSKRDLALPEAVSRLLPAYGQLLRQLQQLGCPEVQLHEPSLATDAGAAAREVYESTYAQLAAVGCPIDLVTYYDDLGEAYPWAVNLPVAAVSLDFCGVPGSAAGNATLDLIRAHGFPASKRLGAGLIDGRSVWADDLAAAAAVLGELSTAHGITSISVQPSTTLQHLPYSTAGEAGHLPAELLPKLAFAVQKLQALADLATPGKVQPAGPEAARVWGQPPDGAAAAKAGSLPGVDAALLARSESYEVRRPKQPEFHAFPTSTIGSFPQTAEVSGMCCVVCGVQRFGGVGRGAGWAC